MAKPDEYDSLCRRLANICNTPIAVVKRDLAREANTRHVRPVLIARERMHCLAHWSVQRITNAVCRDGGSLRCLPHEAVAPLARAMKKAARHGGDVQDYYDEFCKQTQVDAGLVPAK
jgi:hypothetical protein